MINSLVSHTRIHLLFPPTPPFIPLILRSPIFFLFFLSSFPFIAFHLYINFCNLAPTRVVYQAGLDKIDSLKANSQLVALLLFLRTPPHPTHTTTTTMTTTTTTTTTTTLTYEKPQDVALTSHSVMALSLEGETRIKTRDD